MTARALALLAVLLLAPPAAAQDACADRDLVAARLFGGYGERRIASGLASHGGLVELYRAGSGSWTLLIVRPNGLACLIAAGEAWQSDPAPRGGPL